MQETIELLRRQAAALHKAADILEEALTEVEEASQAQRYMKRPRKCGGWKEGDRHHECGKEFMPTGPRSLRCTECATQQRRANDAQYYAERRTRQNESPGQ